MIYVFLSQDEVLNDRAENDREHKQEQRSPKAKVQNEPLQKGIKRKRCGDCPGCSTDECGKCVYCLDMVKYGGPGRKKRCCINRQCNALQEVLKEVPDASHVVTVRKSEVSFDYELMCA